MSIALLILGLFLFVMLVVVHEFGHFIVARRNGVEVEEFGIFFPPRLWSRKTKKGWSFSINVLPLGGFVRLKGERDADTEPHTYGASSLGTKVKIMLAGVGMNLLAAFVLLTILGWIGMPQLVDHQFTVKSDTHVVKNEVFVGYIQPGSPAAKAGLRTSDRLLSIQSNEMLTCLGCTIPAPVPITSVNELPKLTKQYAGQSATLSYERNKHVRYVNLNLLSQSAVAASQKTSNPKGYLGVSPSSYVVQRSTWSAPVVAGGLIWQFTVLTVHGLGSALHGLGSWIAGEFTSNHAASSAGATQATSQIAGPIGVFVILKQGTQLGYQFVLMIIAVISLSLALINLFPLPALDGGKLYTTLISNLIFRRRLSATIENWLYGTSFALIILLVVLISISDVHKFY